MASGIPNVNVNLREDTTQHAQGNAKAESGGHAETNNNVVNNSTLHTIASIAGGALAVLGTLFLLNRGNSESKEDDSHIYEHTADGWKNSKGERPY